VAEPEDDLKHFEQELNKPRLGVKKDRIVTCPHCGKKQTKMQVSLGEETKCKKCGQTFEITKKLAEPAHMVTMAAVDMQIKQMEHAEKFGRVPAPPKKKVTLVKRVEERSFLGVAILIFILYNACITWPVGFVLNIVYLVKARSYAAGRGEAPRGSSLLKLSFILLGIIPLVAVAVVVGLATAGVINIRELLDKLRSMVSIYGGTGW